MRIFAIILFIGIFICTNAQKRGRSRIDSILNELSFAKEDSNKVKLLYRISYTYQSINPDTAHGYIKSGMQLARKLKFEKGVGAFFNLLGNAALANGQTDSADYFLRASYNSHQKSGYYRGQAGTLIDLGALENSKSNYEQAIRYYLKALKIAEVHSYNDYISTIYNNIAAVYFSQEDFSRALAYQLKALSFARENGFRAEEADALLSLGDISLARTDTLSARKYYNSALVIFKGYDNKIKSAEIASKLGTLSTDLYEGLRYKLSAKKIWDSLNYRGTSYTANLGNIGAAYFDLAKVELSESKMSSNSAPDNGELPDLADKYLKDAITLSYKGGDANNYAHFLNVISELQEFKGDYKKALHSLHGSIKVRDSLYSQENKNKIASLESSREIEARDKKIEINQLALSNERRTRWGITAGAGLLLVIGSLLFYQNRLRRKTNTTLLTLNNELDEANKVKTRFFGILSHDLRSPIVNLINFLHLQKEMPELMNKDQVLRYQKQLTEASENLLETMEAMLLWSKSQMEHFAPQKRMIPVQDLFVFLKKQFSNSGIDIRFQDPEQVSLSSDEDYLKTIMYNLTANAIKALAETVNPQIVWKAQQNGNHVELSITDNGPGVHQEQLNALYNENAVVGTRHGLGLHLIRDLAKAINCRVLHQPGLEKGSVFQIIM